MIFYHYTCRNNIELIVKDQLIKKGKVANNNGEVLQSYAVNLTTDIDPVGHGLPDGREISREQAGYLGHSTRTNGKILSLDFTKYRMALDLNTDDSKLVQAINFHNPTIFAALQIAGYLPTSDTMKVSTAELHAIENKIQANIIKGKGHTWWYFLDDIPLNAVKVVSIQNEKGQYMDLPLSEFVPILEDLNAERNARLQQSMLSKLDQDS